MFSRKPVAVKAEPGTAAASSAAAGLRLEFAAERSRQPRAAAASPRAADGSTYINASRGANSSFGSAAGDADLGADMAQLRVALANLHTEMERTTSADPAQTPTRTPARPVGSPFGAAASTHRAVPRTTTADFK